MRYTIAIFLKQIMMHCNYLDEITIATFAYEYTIW